MKTTTYKAPDTKRVQVSYPDGGTRTTTIAELKEKFKSESPQWRGQFFKSLSEDLYAKTAYAEYHILLD